MARPGPRQPGAVVGHLGAQFADHRHRQFGRRGRRRRAEVGGEIDERGIGLVTHRRDQWNPAAGGGPDHDFLVKGPEVFQTAAAPGDNQQVRLRDFGRSLHPVEAFDGARHLLGCAFALHIDAPQQHPARKAVVQAMEDVTDHRAGRRRDHADDIGNVGQRLFAVFVEQPLGQELPAPVFQQLE